MRTTLGEKREKREKVQALKLFISFGRVLRAGLDAASGQQEPYQYLSDLDSPGTYGRKVDLTVPTVRS